MRQFVESLKRLYDGKMISDKEVDTMFVKGSISENERTYILYGAR